MAFASLVLSVTTGKNRIMATLENRAGRYHVIFRFRGRKYSRSLKTRCERTARAHLARLEDNVGRLELGTLELPNGGDIATFLLSDGKRTECSAETPVVRKLRQLINTYLDHVPLGTLADSTISTIRTHGRHLCRILGERTAPESVDLGTLQRYVDRRSREPGIRGQRLSAATIKKEIVTLTLLWNWARQMGYLERPLGTMLHWVEAARGI